MNFEQISAFLVRNLLPQQTEEEKQFADALAIAKLFWKSPQSELARFSAHPEHPVEVPTHFFSSTNILRLMWVPLPHLQHSHPAQYQWVLTYIPKDTPKYYQIMVDDWTGSRPESYTYNEFIDPDFDSVSLGRLHTQSEIESPFMTLSDIPGWLDIEPDPIEYYFLQTLSLMATPMHAGPPNNKPLKDIQHLPRQPKPLLLPA